MPSQSAKGNLMQIKGAEASAKPGAINDRSGSWSCDNALMGVPNNWRLLQKGAQLLHVWIAAISGLMPTMFMTRVRL
jgi:hypothetical protein